MGIGLNHSSFGARTATPLTLNCFISSNLTWWDMSHQEFIFSNSRKLYFSTLEVPWVKDCNFSITILNHWRWLKFCWRKLFLHPARAWESWEIWLWETMLSPQRVDFTTMGGDHIMSVAQGSLPCIVWMIVGMQATLCHCVSPLKGRNFVETSIKRKAMHILRSNC